MTSAYEMGTVPVIEVRHRLRIAREHAGYEQSELADVVGVSRNTIGNMEKGRSAPRRIIINAWALACGVPVTWLMTGKEPNPDLPGRDIPTGWSQRVYQFSNKAA
jgi:DNA-binding XRE family transcriptional regulator